MVDALNQVFTLFRLNFHNQYYSAWGDAAQLSQIKRLWLESLAHFGAETILLGTRRCLETSQYLPTLARMRECCEQVRMQARGLPDAHSAYREACLAAEPRHAQRWSHPAVYHAGRETGWFLLASTPEARAFPLFERHYRELCERLTRGEVLELPAPASAEQHAPIPLSPEEQREQLARLRLQTGFD